MHEYTFFVWLHEDNFGVVDKSRDAGVGSAGRVVKALIVTAQCVFVFYSVTSFYDITVESGGTGFVLGIISAVGGFEKAYFSFHSICHVFAEYGFAASCTDIVFGEVQVFENLVHNGVTGCARGIQVYFFVDARRVGGCGENQRNIAVGTYELVVLVCSVKARLGYEVCFYTVFECRSCHAFYYQVAAADFFVRIIPVA